MTTGEELPQVPQPFGVDKGSRPVPELTTPAQFENLAVEMGEPGTASRTGGDSAPGGDGASTGRFVGPIVPCLQEPRVASERGPASSTKSSSSTRLVVPTCPNQSRRWFEPASRHNRGAAVRHSLYADPVGVRQLQDRSGSHDEL